MALRVELVCYHLIWPVGDQSMYEVGAEAYCTCCRTRREITSVGQASC